MPLVCFFDFAHNILGRTMVFACQKRERQFGGDVEKEVTDILTASTFQDQNEEFSMWFCGLRCFAADQNALCAF